jgi:hypothetical protein
MSEDFPKMGLDAVTSGLVNISGIRVPYTIPKAKGTMGRGSSPTGVKKNHANVMIHEANGPTFRPVTTRAPQTCPEAGATQRNTRFIPSSVGNRDFWAGRAASNKA